MNKLTLIALIFLVALVVWAPRQLSLQLRRQALAGAQSRMTDLAQRLAAADVMLASAGDKLRQASLARDQVLAAVASAEFALRQADPDRQWITPPPILPEWNPESPYVWIRKEIAPRLPVEAFSKDGTLHPGVAMVLAIDSSAQRRLNGELRRILRSYQDQELANAEFVDEPLPGIGIEDGPTVTLRVQPLPEEGARVKQQFESALRSELGEQRAELVWQSAEGWLDSQFRHFGTEAKVISAVRHPDGTHNIAIKTGNNWLTVGGAISLEDYVPGHLLPVFSNWEGESAPAGENLPRAE
jgi:hypothetical protein